MEFSLATTALVGFIVLAVVFLIVIRKNKNSDVPVEHTEQATKKLYEEEHEDGQRHGGNA